MTESLENNIHDNRCLNCNSAINNDANYCLNCGALLSKGRLSTKEVFKELFEVILIWNKDFFKTFLHLLISPDRVISFYIRGGRNRYVNPMLYLLFSFFLLLLFSSLLDKELFFIDSMKGAVGGIDSANESGTLNEDSVDKLKRYSKLLYFLILPVVALVTKIIFRSSNFNFAEHLSVNAYMLGVATILAVITMPLHSFTHVYVSSIAAIILQVIYIPLFHYRIFQNKLFLSVIKSILFFLLSSITLTILYIPIAVIVASVSK